MAEDQEDNMRHFNMREIEKAEKEARRKNKKHKKKTKTQQDGQAAGRDDFAVETKDPRFKALFESHEFAIDPTNPRFKGTEGMKALLEEGRKKRKVEDPEAGDPNASGNKVKKRAGDDELGGLVKRLKSKSKSQGR